MGELQDAKKPSGGISATAIVVIAIACIGIFLLMSMGTCNTGPQVYEIKGTVDIQETVKITYPDQKP